MEKTTWLWSWRTPYIYWSINEGDAIFWVQKIGDKSVGTPVNEPVECHLITFFRILRESHH